MADIVIAKQITFATRAEGNRVLVIADGQCILDLEWNAAEQLIHGLRISKLKAEEFDKREHLAQDSAIMLRAGMPLVLSARQDVKDEAVKRAAFDSDLRRYMPGIPSQQKFGHPVIEVLPPTPKGETP